MRGHVWNFAKIYTQLAKLEGADAVFPWTWVSQAPTDIARILNISVADEPVEYELVRDKIYSMKGPVDIRYVSNYSTADEGFSFPDDFSETLSCRLAAEMCMAITQSPQLKQELMQAYMLTMAEARFNGAVERFSVDPSDSPWLRAHDGFVDVDPRTRGLSGY